MTEEDVRDIVREELKRIEASKPRYEVVLDIGSMKPIRPADVHQISEDPV